MGGTTARDLTVSGTFTQVDDALTTLANTDSTGSTDTITVNATDQFGNTATAVPIAVTVNGLPAIAVPGLGHRGCGQGVGDLRGQPVGRPA